MTDLSADYVVVGSGAGGGPLAMRLAAAGHSVIVIEAGVATGPGDLAYEVPGFHAYASEDETMTWSYFVQHYDDPQQAERDPKYRAEPGGVLYPRCATVGGCTAHNAMIIVRPNNADWDGHRRPDRRHQLARKGHERLLRASRALPVRCSHPPTAARLVADPRPWPRFRCCAGSPPPTATAAKAGCRPPWPTHCC